MPAVESPGPLQGLRLGLGGHTEVGSASCSPWDPGAAWGGCCPSGQEAGPSVQVLRDRFPGRVGSAYMLGAVL